MRTIVILFAFIPFLSSAQAFEKGTISGDVNFGLGLYLKSEVNEKYQNYSQSRRDSAGATYAKFNVSYGVLNFLNVGIDFRTGKYLEEEDNAADYDNRFTNINLRAEGVFLNKDKFAMFADLNMGKLWLRQWSTGVFNIENKYSGISLGFGLGLKWFPFENVGLNMVYSRNRYNLFLRDQTIGTSHTDLSDYELNLDVKGGEFSLGLSFKF